MKQKMIIDIIKLKTILDFQFSILGAVLQRGIPRTSKVLAARRARVKEVSIRVVCDPTKSRAATQQMMP